jgi:exodeoxyribonuclease VII large subunit
MLRVANKRYPLVAIDIYDVLVQGEGAAYAISHAIDDADTKGYDILVIARGGGSIEDLWAFNEERVADAIFQAKTPIVSAIGHEIDYLISDFVADLRAATPSAAMEIILPDRNELYIFIDSLVSQLQQKIDQKISHNTQELQHLQKSYQQHSVFHKLQQTQGEIAQLQDLFTQRVLFKIESAKRELATLQDVYPQTINSSFQVVQNQLINIKKMLESNHPKYKTKKGFAQIAKENRVIDIESLHVDDIFEAQSDTVVVRAKVIQKEYIHELP